jgi:acyl carrier protein
MKPGGTGMASVINPERVLSEVRTVVVETLRLDEDTVQPESSCVADLGAESLDFLDINYQVEQIFGIKMARHFFLEHAEEIYGEGETIDDHGKVTERGLALLRLRYGSAAGLEGATGLDIDGVPALITVRAIADAVTDILSSLPDRCPCGAAKYTSDDGTHVICGSCGEPARYDDGDELIKQWLVKREPA